MLCHHVSRNEEQKEKQKVFLLCFAEQTADLGEAGHATTLLPLMNKKLKLMMTKTQFTSAVGNNPFLKINDHAFGGNYWSQVQLQPNNHQTESGREGPL